MTLLFDEAKLQVLDDARKPPQCTIQLERCDRIVSPAANAIPTPSSALEYWTFCHLSPVLRHRKSQNSFHQTDILFDKARVKR